MKLDNNYDTLWTKYYGEKTSPWDTSYVARELIITSNNKLVNTGWITPELNYQHQFYLIQFDTSGNFLWEKFYSYPNTNYILKGYSVIETPDKGFAIGAYRYKPGFNYTGEPMVYKIDSLGNEEWFIDVGGPYYDNIAYLCNAYDGNIIEANCYADSMSGSSDAYRTINIKKIDLVGNIIWDKRYGTSEYNNRVSNIRQINDGGYIATGYTWTPQMGYPVPHISGWMLKINNDGDSLWYRTYYNINQNYDMNYLYDIIPTSDNGFAACGEVSGPTTNYTQHAWVIKVDSMGCDTPGCATGVFVHELFPYIRGRGEELYVYPNPVSKKFKVKSLKLKVKGDKTIRIYNSQGIKVEEIKMPTRKEIITVNVQSWPKGIYFVQLVVDGVAVGSKKIIKN